MKNTKDTKNTNDIFEETPWIEKYRPYKLKDVLIDEFIKKNIEFYIADLDLPNCILKGVPGVGKTSTIKCIANELFGKEYKKEAILELNASDDRGIRVVEETITAFCKKKLVFNEENRKYPKHKLVILDEAENITEKAQNLIKNLMDEYHKTTRFVFTCNNSTDIIRGIQSKCTKINFLPLEPKIIAERLKFICNKKNIEMEKNSVETLSLMAEGDVRTAINNLQLVYSAFKKITINGIYTVCNKPKPELINEILDNCKQCKLKEAIKAIDNLVKEGFSEYDIVTNMIYVIRYDLSHLNEKEKHLFLDHICLKQYVMSKGYVSLIQLTACIADIILTLDK